MIKHFLILINLSFLLSSCNTDNPFPYSIEKKEIFKTSSMNGALTFIDDLNNNYNSELILINYDYNNTENFYYKIQVFDLFDINNGHLHSENIWDELKDVKAHDFNNDRIKEIIYTYERNDSLFLKVYSPFAKEGGKSSLINNFILQVEKLKVDKFWAGACKIQKFIDLNHDGFDDVILRIQAMYAGLPRGLIAYDIYNNKKLWYFPTGTVVHDINIFDLNNDGINEISFNTAAPGNGAAANGTDDVHSYFIIIDENGNLIFKKEMAGENSQTVVKYDYFTSRTEKDLISITFSGNYYGTNENSIIVWDWNKDLNFFPEKISSNYSLISSFEILPYKKVPHIFAITKTNKLCVIDTSLTVIDTILKGTNFFAYINNFDFNKDGLPEHIYIIDKEKYAIFSSDFELLTEIPKYNKLLKVNNGRNRDKKNFVIAPNKTISEISMKELPITLKFLSKPWEKIIAGLVIANLLFLFFLYYKTGNWKWYRDQLKYFENSSFAVFVLDIKGNVITINKKGEELLKLTQHETINNFVPGLFNSLYPEVAIWIKRCLGEKHNSKSTFKIKSNTIEQTLDIQLQFIYSRLGRKEGALLIINDITPIMQSQRNAAWLTIAQKLAHEIKNPLTTIRLSLQRIQMEYEDKPQLRENLEGVIKDSLNEATRVRKVIDDFMRFSKIETDNPGSVSIKELIRDIADKYLLTIPNNINIKTEIEENIPDLFAVESQLYSVLSNLIDNAIQSIKQKGEILIKVRAAEILENNSYLGINEFVIIEILDTGIGMDKIVLDKIFQPFYTTKEGGSGLGLIIVKKIIEDHGGTIEIFSKKGLGTNVTIKLPVKNGSKN